MVATIWRRSALDGGERVLDVGTGSGYQAALLAELADEVVTIERVPSSPSRRGGHSARPGYGDVEVRVGDGTLGVPERAPFDGIVVAAAAPAVPEALYEQLAPGGRIVVPVGTDATSGSRSSSAVTDGPVRSRTVPCRFVPLLGSAGVRRLAGRVACSSCGGRRHRRCCARPC